MGLCTPGVHLSRGGRLWSSQGKGSSQASLAQLLRPDAAGHSEPSPGVRAPSGTPGWLLCGRAPAWQAGAGPGLHAA